jgi:myo-inositol 2-dehydrogenase / D-chiro-inositol 1-dehydrogenase
MKRRDFIKNTAVSTVAVSTAALGIPTLVPASVFGRKAPSNRITVGMIGLGRQGFSNNLQGSSLEKYGMGRMPGFLDIPDVQVVAVCDVDSWRMQAARQVVDAAYAKKFGKETYKGCDTTGDFRELIDRKDVDTLMISTPDHWHTLMGIMAARAKKPFSIEKPLSLSVHQGRELADAVKKAGIIARTDSEFRSLPSYHKPVELIRNGYIGKLERIEISFPSDPDPVAPQPDMPVPAELNYDMWLGPAPQVPYTEKRVHNQHDHKSRPNWMRLNTYAQGMISNWGAHYFDIAQWANNAEYSGPVEVSGKGYFPKSLWDTMINFEVKYRYANGVEMTCRQAPDSKPYIHFFGSEASIFIDDFPGKVTSSKPAILTALPQAGQMDTSKILMEKVDFIEGVRNNRPTLEPIEVGHRTISVSQIGLIACQVGETLQWNPEKELFIGNNAANALLAAPLVRKEWII